MCTKNSKLLGFLALFSAFFAFFVLPVSAIETVPVVPAANKVVLPSKTLPAGFYQFNNLEIFKGPTVDEPPATVEVIQKNDPATRGCVVYENGKSNQPLPCVFNDNQPNNYIVQIEERTTLLGINQEPALLSDFVAGEKINVLGWLSADSKTIRAAVVRSLEPKDFHQSFSGTIKNVTGDGFVLILSNGDEIMVKTPIVGGAQVTIKGVFDKVNEVVSSVLSILVKPMVVLEEPVSVEKPAAPAAKKPSALFKNFLKVFGL
ncbi:hypothetical protein A2127_00335 [Candidatus Jorgensenbacteria bacterium GWC1_48_12]|uniref:DUF5666 domain-containing protein n=2 Tax=Parcubacteria group TaxID=1794811 RepID=A0A1F6BRZ8_9BACT|nr:MAG: hypothetical protein A2127_00335 [Candidatus Jorgensenbacteria bacterium GWC1_48_12]OGZ94460.1 MAG: hypothetical protein A2131_01485 [Candidatus Sungbacteria bacterium GWC2_49_10]